MTRAIVILVLMGGGPLVACVERPLLGDATGDGASSTSTGEGGGQTSGLPTSSGSTEGTQPQPGTTDTGTEPGTTTTGNPGSTTTTASEDTCGFICETTGTGGESTEKLCDTFTQDCPEGEKCAPYAEGGGSSWNATKCVPVTGDGQPGEPCTSMGGGVSGLDDCAEGVMCWDVDDMNQGYCVGMCTGSESRPICPGGSPCATTGDGILNLCLPHCDPLIQDCLGNDLCIPVGDTFVCADDGSGDEGQVFDPCEFANACDKGLLCLNPIAAEECDKNAGGCCMPFCDLVDPNVVCPGVGTSCVSLYEKGMAPEEYKNVGICVLP